MAKSQIEQKGQKAMLSVLLVYLICCILRIFEYFVLRTDKSWIGEAVVHKLAGIIVLFVTAKILHFTSEEIGFAKENSILNLLKGLALGLGVFAVAYMAETLILNSRGQLDSLQLYVSSYAIDQNVGHNTQLLFFIICIIGNIINVLMEEGVFRGLFSKILSQKYSFIISALTASLLFGIWHIVAPVRSYYDGTSSMGGTIANAIMLLSTSALVGFKFALITKMTGSIYMGMGDHFVNNTIVNLLHVVSASGADELMVVRVSIAQSLSFIIVLVYYILWRRKK